MEPHDLEQPHAGVMTAPRTVREDPSLTLTDDGRVAAKPVAELRRLYPELPSRFIATIHHEATTAAAAYTAERVGLPIG